MTWYVQSKITVICLQWAIPCTMASPGYPDTSAALSARRHVKPLPVEVRNDCYQDLLSQVLGTWSMMLAWLSITGRSISLPQRKSTEPLGIYETWEIIRKFSKAYSIEHQNAKSDKMQAEFLPADDNRRLLDLNMPAKDKTHVIRIAPNNGWVKSLKENN